MYRRVLDLGNLLKMRSFFLFGPRGTGKSTLIKETLKEAKVYNLLDPETFQRLVRYPKLISQETKASTLVVIDEIQKMPSLLDEVHLLIVERAQRFLLTGSSARKLKRGGINSLAGRALTAELFPLVSAELEQFDLLNYLNTTGLPEFSGKPMAQEFLRAYVGTYLKEEIQAEALTRNLQAFSRFLEVMALGNGQELNLTNIASDVGIPAKTIQGYLGILDDTLLGFLVPAFQKTRIRKAIARPKYYLFDIGVVNTLAYRGNIALKSELFGTAFEHFIAMELRAWLSYRRLDAPLSYWRSTTQFEVDFILGDQLALEVKGTDLVVDKHLKSLRALKEEGLVKNYGVVSLDADERTTQDNIHIWPWQIFLQKLWKGDLVVER
ncbi:MAG TPA: AAA family ATPase [Myxococcota bacterium]|nr:AAA family ATPase [Myxococcota bacterium]